MSTRSVTHIHEMDDLDGKKIVCSFYRHADGYPSGHGQDLADWLAGKNLVNGIGVGFRPGIDFNRAGTMAVPLMAHIQEISGCEVVGNHDQKEEFTYHVYFDRRFHIECIDSLGRSVRLAASHFDGNKLEDLWGDES